jgi:ribosome-associated heat shock protein Hsp15
MADGMRLDRFLWWSRISASRSYAQALAEGGHLRLNGRRIERSAVPVRVGDILAFVTHLGKVRVVRVQALPTRRGPPDEGRACYEELVTKAENVSHQGPID